MVSATNWNHSIGAYSGMYLFVQNSICHGTENSTRYLHNNTIRVCLNGTGPFTLSESERESENFLWYLPLILWSFFIVPWSFSLPLSLSLGVNRPLPVPSWRWGRVLASYTRDSRFKYSNYFLKLYYFCHWIRWIQWKHFVKFQSCHRSGKSC